MPPDMTGHCPCPCPQGQVVSPHVMSDPRPCPHPGPGPHSRSAVLSWSVELALVAAGLVATGPWRWGAVGAVGVGG